MQESRIKCGIPGGIKFSSQVGKVGSHHLRRDPAIPTWDPGWDCQDPAYIPPDILPGLTNKRPLIFFWCRMPKTCFLHKCLFFECCLVYLSYPLSERKRNKNERKQIAQINKNMGLKTKCSQMYLFKTAFSAK